ncbi:MAG TPA: hypothetical protein PLP26_11800, partial [Ilumatobacteraceae bacterium]|nr:hypothetical protein [Ilumatobacteraceae bacterium]
ARDPLGTTIMVALVALLFVSITEPFLLGTFSMIALFHSAALSRVPRSEVRRRAAIERAH